MSASEFKDFSRIAIEHALHPKYKGILIDSNGHAMITGPCGDTMAFWLLVKNDSIFQIAFFTDGCGSSNACGSMAASLAIGKSVREAAFITQGDILKALDGLPKEFEHCALLASMTLSAACRNHMNDGGADSDKTQGNDSSDDNRNQETKIGTKD